MSLHSNSLEQVNVVLKCKDEREGVHVTRKQCPWTRFSSFESSMSNEHIQYAPYKVQLAGLVLHASG